MGILNFFFHRRALRWLNSVVSILCDIGRLEFFK
jgi:hypothetical protein